MSTIFNELIPSSNTPGLAGGVAVIAKKYIGMAKEFNITISCSSSTGFAYDLMTGPVSDDSASYISATGGAFIAGACATLGHRFLNNNQNYLEVKVSATGVVSAAHINIFFTSIEREN